nr:MAG TPA: hypothetical protein [Caudoviricetes sp.]
MTRKRYIKLLMSFGYTRNLAQARAAIDLPSYGNSYARAFAALDPYLRARGALRDMCARVVSTWRAIQPQLRRTVQDVVSALAAVGKEGEE